MNPTKAPKILKSDSPRCFIPYKKKKQLRWAEISTLVVTARKTESENEASWYNKDEIRQFKRDTKVSSVLLAGTHDSKMMKLLGHFVQKGTAQPNVKVQDANLIRGLEHLLSREVCSLLVQSRRLTIAKVLEEQKRQTCLGEYDAARIAFTSNKSSRFAVSWRQIITTV